MPTFIVVERRSGRVVAVQQGPAVPPGAGDLRTVEVPDEAFADAFAVPGRLYRWQPGAPGAAHGGLVHEPRPPAPPAPERGG